MTQNNFNYISQINLITQYSDLTLQGVMGICCNSSGKNIYAIDYCGYLLIIKNTSSIENPIFTYSSSKTPETPKTDNKFLANNNYTIIGNYIQCATTNDVDTVVFAYPTYSDDDAFTSPYAYYLFKSNNFIGIGTFSNIYCPQFVISPDCNFILINDTGGNTCYLYDIKRNITNNIVTSGNFISAIGISLDNNYIYLLCQNQSSGYYVLWIHDIASDTNILAQTLSIEYIWTFVNNIYTDISGQFIVIPLYTYSSNTFQIITIDSYGANVLSYKSNGITVFPSLYINQNNSSNGNVMAICTTNYECTSPYVFSTIDGPDNFSQETYFNTSNLYITFLSTNYCNINSIASIVIMGSESFTDITPFIFIYGYRKLN